MDHHIEDTIAKFYPKQVLISPLSDPSVNWAYDPKYEKLKALLTELREMDSTAHPGTRPNFDISEEVVLLDNIHIYLSYLGPFAAINYGDDLELDESQQEAVRAVERLLARHKVTLLDDGELDESVAWITAGTTGRHARVWDCLFVNETGDAIPAAAETAPKSVIQWR